MQIRNVPEDVRRALKARAAARGESLNSYLLALVERDVARPTVEEVLDRAARRAGRAGASAVDVLDEARGDATEAICDTVLRDRRRLRGGGRRADRG